MAEAKPKKPIKFNPEEIYAKLSPPGKILFFAALMMFTLALMDRIFVGPILTQMKNMDAEIGTKKEAIKRDWRILSYQRRIYEEYSKYNTYLDSSDKAQEEIIAALLKKIETLAQQQAISIKDIRPGDVEEKPMFQIYKTSIQCEGKLTDVLEFMNLLEQSDYLFEITRYDIAPKSKGADVVKSSMDIARTLITVEKVDLDSLAGKE